MLRWPTLRSLAFTAGLLLTACGNSGGKATPTDVSNDTLIEDSVEDLGADNVEDAVEDGTGDVADLADAPEPGLPNISEALDCGAGPPTGPGNSNELQRFALDLTTFPDALCNDGSNAVFYFRPYVGEENRNKWLINLNGGGSCGSGPACAARWCWCRSTTGADGCPFAETTTNFSMANMDSDTRASIAGSGITLRGDTARPNPIGDYNQVRLIYCSSDAWMGTHRASPLTAKHPKTGADVAFSMHFLGARILDAALATLRRDGAVGPTYTFGASPVELPDLDDAIEVIISGDSAGGAGVIGNLDRISDLLRANNSGCTGGTCPLVVRGLMDAIVGPELARLDYSTSIYAALGGPTYALAMTAIHDLINPISGIRYDESCVAWHAANAPETAYQCADLSHIIRNHVTTPFFVRMALLDQLISGNYIEALYSDPVLGLMTVGKFAVILHRELATFAVLPAAAEEGAAMAMAPGVFAPGCPKHDTIHDNGEVYLTSITPAGGSPLHLFDVFEAWRNRGAPTSVLTESPTGADTFCAP